jgi:hypothetical protein
VGFSLVSSVRQAFDPYLDGLLNEETVPQTTGGTQPLVLKKYVLRVYFDMINTHCTIYRF